MFSKIGALAVAMGIVFLLTNCKPQVKTTPTKVTITYSTEKGVAPTPKTVDLGYKLKTGDLAPLSASGFVFDGWYIGTEKVVVGYAVTKSITLSAKWTAASGEKVTITYSTEKGTAPASQTVDLGYKLTAGDLAPLSASGFVFDGWYIGTEKAVVGYAVTTNITLTAKWSAASGEKVTITYSTAKGTAPASKTVDLGYKLTMADVAPISASGFVFDDWYIGTEKAAVGYAVTTNITLTAKWSAASGEKVTITYSTEKGTAPASKTVDLGYKLTTDDLAPLSASGFVFDDWYIGTEKAAVGYAVTTNITLTAKWSAASGEKVTITYSTEKGTAPASKTVDLGYKLTMADVAPISASGFVFDDWYIGTEKAAVGYAVTTNITLTAKWSAASGEKVTITYSTEKGTAPASKTVDLGYKLTTDDLAPISASGFVFDGWYIGTEKASVGYAVTKNILLTAKWSNAGELQYISFTTSKNIGETIALAINAESADQPYVWLDLNNNGIKDAGEEVTHFARDFPKAYTIAQQTFRLYGNVTYLKCTINELTSLDANGCAALEYLRCDDNPLTSLDVSGCTALETLNCSFYHYEKDGVLTNLDVSGCTALKYLYCHNNQLTSLDVNGFTALTELVCSDNKISNIDGLNTCTKLSRLNCSYNQLTNLDISGCTALENLLCEKNQLTSLDVSGRTTLKILNCDYNHFTSFHVSGCTALEALYCRDCHLTNLDVSGCIALKKLFCNGNQLTNLDVSGFTALEMLECDLNQLGSLNASNCTALKYLSCRANQLTSLRLNTNGCTTLAELDCAFNQFISFNVSDYKALKKLRCRDNQLTALDVSGCTTLTELSCFNNRLTSLDVNGCIALESLICDGNQLTSLNVNGCTALTELSCSKNRLISLDVNGCTALTELKCYKNKIQGVKMDTLIQSLPVKKKSDNANFYITDSLGEPLEGNKYTDQNISDAKAKNWKVYDYVWEL